ncbi:MAG: tRNA (adenosine(37)-N6)-threonylcarbamoyltransferase complex ATPase subunit type 1 TsaE [Proteobacteria bacterium]|nr:tRNA (adenosine(37)-N6)-threonylcarbamoyltransferase complex ATPase subunit type 1 TsaE [Pseudomonadota bacterium]
MNTPFLFVADSVEKTNSLGRELGSVVRAGDMIALSGELGAGKTTFVKALATGLGISEDDVSSPSYTLLNEYDGRIPMYHFDLYRLEGADDVDDLGFDEYMDGDGLAVVEWADVAPQILPSEYLEIKIMIKGKESRNLELKGIGERYVKLVEHLREDMKGVAS